MKAEINQWSVYVVTSIKMGIAACGINWAKNGKIVRRSKFRFGNISHPLASLLSVLLSLKPLADGCTTDEIIIHTPSEYAVNAAIGTHKAKKNIAAVQALQARCGKFDNLEIVCQSVEGKVYQSAYRTSIEAAIFLKDVKDLTYKIGRYK